MMLREEKSVDKIEVLDDGTIQVRVATVILKDDEQIAKTYECYCIMKNESLEGQPERVVAIARAAWSV